MTPEEYLFRQKRWATARELASTFNCTERSFRGEDSPIRRCSISGDKGYKHIRWATSDEISHYCNRLRRHALEEIKHAELIAQIRREMIEGNGQLALL